MQRDPDHNLCRHALARQVLKECERRGLRVWQQFGECTSAELPGAAGERAEPLATGSGGPFLRNRVPT
jgi:hypothetical protein